MTTVMGGYINLLHGRSNNKLAFCNLTIRIGPIVFNVDIENIGQDLTAVPDPKRWGPVN
jgi:hypothetical protein